MRPAGGAGAHDGDAPLLDVLSRRSFLERAGMLGAATALAQLPSILDARGLLETALAQSSDVVADTLSGLVAFILPGSDPFSVAQGQSSNEPGGIAAGAVPVLTADLDAFVPASVLGSQSSTLPASGGVAALLNAYALQVNPAAGQGDFLSPFARLSFAEKAAVFRLFESDVAADGTELRFVAGILPGFVGFLSFSEAGVYDPARRAITARPVGWQLSRYGGPAEGHAELRGYYQGAPLGEWDAPATRAPAQADAPAPQERALMRDVIVIGAGGGGPVVAKELAARGLDVLLLEAGARFPHPAREWVHLENDANSPVNGYFRFGPSDRSRPAWLRELPQNSFLWQVAGVGGTTLHYYGNCPRAQPGVFRGYRGRNRAAFDRAHEFPFTYRELVPYYEWVEHTLPVQTAAMGTKEQVFLRGAARMGLPVQRSKDTHHHGHRPQENAILQPGGTAGRTADASKLVYPKARGCTFCGFCFQGCYEPRGAPRNLAAKRSTDNSYVPMALTADRWHRGGKAVTLIADAFVTRIDTDTSGGQTVARSVTWRDNPTGQTSTEEAKVVVLAGGCTENPRLWLNSSLPNPNDWVGRGYTDHYFDWVIGVMPFYTGSSKGPGSAARCDYPGRGGLENVGLPPALQAFSATFSDAGMAGFYDNGSPSGRQGADALGRRVGLDLRRLLTDVDRLLNVLVITDDDVEAQNRVTLSTTLPNDEHGPVAKVEFHQRNRSVRTRANREFLARRAVALLKAAGAREIYRLNWPPLILHVQSTMRMGADSSNSVLDETAESRFVKRLFVADNSALPNSLGGPNPTLTTQALATRTAERIFVKYFGGSPWVAHESPLASTDRRVTRAVVARGL